jgi:hypothetical protein
VVGPLNEWISRVFGRDQVDHTVAAMLAAQSATATMNGQRERAEARVGRCSDPAATSPGRDRSRCQPRSGGRPNQQSQTGTGRRAGRAGSSSGAGRGDRGRDPRHDRLTRRLGQALAGVRPESLSKLYESIGLEPRYVPDDQVRRDRRRRLGSGGRNCRAGSSPRSVGVWSRRRRSTSGHRGALPLGR